MSKSYRLATNVSEETRQLVTQVASQNNMSIAKLIRLVLTDELQRELRKTKYRLDEETREILVNLLTEIVTEISRISRTQSGIGTNLNQLAKSANSGDNVTIDEEVFSAMIELHGYDKEQLLNLEKAVSELWQLLV